MFDYKTGDIVQLLANVSLEDPMIGMTGIIVDVCQETYRATVLWSNNKIESLRCWEVCLITAR